MKTSAAMLLLLPALALLSSRADAAPASMSFTARISAPNGAPVDGDVTVVFRIFDAGSGGSLLWEETQALSADDGLLYAELGSIDSVNNGLDATVFAGDVRFLEVQIGDETLSPRLALLSVPYAISSGHADRAERLGTLGEDDVQVRVANGCPAGQAIRTINADGSVACELDDDTDAGGDITAVTAGTGLSGGGSTGAVSLSVDTTAVQRRVVGSCAAGQAIRAIASDGTVTCEIDDNTGGDITGIAAGAGLSGGGSSGNVALSVDTTQVQSRVGGMCPTGQAIRAIGIDGTVTCEIDDDTNAGGDITAVTAGSGLSGGGGTGAVTLGIASLGVTTTHLANNAVTMAKTSAPIGVSTSQGTTVPETEDGVAVGPGFTADADGACLVSAKLYISFNTGANYPVTHTTLAVAATENGSPLALAGQLQTISPDHVTTMQQTTVIILTHHYQAQASYVVPVIAGRTYQFGCAFGVGDDSVIPAGVAATCQASYVCQ